jgi:hypothetical protein
VKISEDVDNKKFYLEISGKRKKIDSGLFKDPIADAALLQDNSSGLWVLITTKILSTKRMVNGPRGRKISIYENEDVICKFDRSGQFVERLDLTEELQRIIGPNGFSVSNAVSPLGTTYVLAIRNKTKFPKKSNCVSLIKIGGRNAK